MMIPTWGVSHRLRWSWVFNQFGWFRCLEIPLRYQTFIPCLRVGLPPFRGSHWAATTVFWIHSCNKTETQRKQHKKKKKNPPKKLISEFLYYNSFLPSSLLLIGVVCCSSGAKTVHLHDSSNYCFYRCSPGSKEKRNLAENTARVTAIWCVIQGNLVNFQCIL